MPRRASKAFRRVERIIVFAVGFVVGAGLVIVGEDIPFFRHQDPLLKVDDYLRWVKERQVFYATTVRLAVAKEAAIGILSVIDLLLVAAGLQIMALGIYRIFLNSRLDVPSGLRVSSFGELKVSLVKIVGLVLLILFLENAFKLGPGLPILYFGLAIAIVIAAFAWAISHEKNEG